MTALRRGNSALSIRLIETYARSTNPKFKVQSIGAPYRVIWTRREGRVDRPINTSKKRVSDEYLHPNELPRADAFADSFRSRCALLPPLPGPQFPLLPQRTYQMSHAEWLATLDNNHPVVGLAHSLCLPPGELKQKVSSMIAEHFQTHPRLKAEACKMLNPFLAASVLYGAWEWDPAVGLRKIKRERQA